MDPKECELYPVIFEQYFKKQLTSHHCDTLAIHFRNHKIFTEDQFSEVYESVGPQKKIKFLQHIQSVASDTQWYSEFVNAMNMAGATHITDYLEGRNVDGMAIEKLWEESVTKHYLAFQKAFNPEPVLLLYGPSLFDNPTLELINSLQTRSDQVNAFFIHVVKKPIWLETLLIALRDPECGDMTHLVQLLDPEDNLRGKAFLYLIDWCVPRFQEILDPDDILDDMICIPDSSKRSIRSIKARKEKVTKFVNILKSLDVGWFKELLAALDLHTADKPEYMKLLDLIDPNHAVTDGASEPEKETAAATSSTSTDTREYGEAAESSTLKSGLNEDDPAQESTNREEECSRTFVDEPVVVPAKKLATKVSEPCPSDIEQHPSPVESPSSPIEGHAPSVQVFASPVEESISTVEDPASTVEDPASPVQVQASSVQEVVSNVEERASPVDCPANPLRIKIPSNPQQVNELVSPVDRQTDSPPLNISSSPDPELAPVSVEMSMDPAEVIQSTVETRKVADKNPNLNKNVSPVSHDKEKEVLVLRDYQLELAQTGLEGRNCMIVAPTGSGKTFVALHICIEHMKKVKDPKVILLVPRIPLVKQQFELFKRFMANDQKIFQVTGDMSSNVPVHILIERHDVIVMTAQILVNLISDGLTDITNITMLIFDECHHTVKNEPYNQIMRVYLDKRCEKKDAKLPQVVGLTASPGMGKAKTMAKAHDNIKMLMANLDVKTAPVQVRTEKGDLDGFQHEAQDEVIPVYRRDENSFFVNIKAKMQRIQRLIEEDITRYENVIEGRIVFDLRATPGTQDYEAWAVNLLNKSKLIKHDESSQRFMAYARNLHEYNNSLMLNDHVRSVDALEYITEVLFKKDPINPIEVTMKNIFDRPVLKPSDDGNPLLDSLKDKLCEEFSKKPNSRCIIFVKTRAVARALLIYLTEQTQLKEFKLNPKQLTGAAARRDNFGMTKVGQDDNLSAFREGICKVLVATSVAEEGLDIKECNLIITYNYSTNEVGQVQRKGRGRAKDSKVVMLAYSDSGHVQRERENAIRVELTQDILSKLHLLKPDQLDREITTIQETLQKDREFEKAVETYRSKVRKPNPGVFRLSCLWCKKTVTSSDKFRHIKKQHRVVVDIEFNDRAEFKVVPDSEAKQLGDEQFLIGKIFCKNKQCRRVWGLRMRYKNFPISVLRIENFLITNDKGYRAVKKKWKDAPFVVDKELTSDNLKELVGVQNDQEDDEEEDDPDLVNQLNID